MRQRYVPRTTDDRPTVPFGSAEEAWFWFSRCQRIRAEGARLEGRPGSAGRPCDPDDIYRAAMGLFRRGTLQNAHLRILCSFALQERPPDSRCDTELVAARLWDEALDRLTTVLRAKGIIA